MQYSTQNAPSHRGLRRIRLTVKYPIPSIECPCRTQTKQHVILYLLFVKGNYFFKATPIFCDKLKIMIICCTRDLAVCNIHYRHELNLDNKIITYFHTTFPIQNTQLWYKLGSTADTRACYENIPTINDQLWNSF